MNIDIHSKSRENNMLLESGALKIVEQDLHKNGVIEKFISENGEITLKMMITEGVMPDELNIKLPKDGRVFLASFDKFDMVLGVAINIVSKEPISPIWGNMQKENADMPDEDIQNLFIDKIYKAIEEKRFGYPICVFMNDAADITTIPSSTYQFKVFMTNHQPSDLMS